MTPADTACKCGRAMWVYWRTQSTWWLLLCSTTKLQFFKRCTIYYLLPGTFNYHLVTFLFVVLWHVEEDDLWHLCNHQQANRCAVCHSICLGCKEWAYLVLLHYLIVLYHCSVHLCAFSLRQAVQNIQCVEVCHYIAHRWASLLDLRRDMLYQKCDAKVPARVEASSTLSTKKEGSLPALICLLSMCNYCHYPGWYCMLIWYIMYICSNLLHMCCAYDPQTWCFHAACSMRAASMLLIGCFSLHRNAPSLNPHYILSCVTSLQLSVFRCVWIIRDYSIVTLVSTIWYTVTIA